MQIYDFTDINQFLRDRIASSPNNGRGQLSKLSKELKISSVAMSHLFHGRNNFNQDQGIILCEYFGLQGLEEDYLLALIDLQRAGTQKLKNHIISRMEQIKKKALDTENYLSKSKSLNDEKKAIYYSDWLYSAVRLTSSIQGINSPQELSRELGIEQRKINEILDFLFANGLLTKNNDGYEIGTKNIHINQNSPFINNHRRNWRLKALEKMNQLDEEDLFFVSPMVLSRSDAREIRKEIQEAIKKIIERVIPSKEETTICLNIDFFKY